MSITIPKYKDGYNQTYLEISMKQGRGQFTLLETCSAPAVQDTEVAIGRQLNSEAAVRIV